MHGYSEIARLIRRNNLDVKTVYFESDAMPTCDVLVVAAPLAACQTRKRILSRIC